MTNWPRCPCSDGLLAGEIFRIFSFLDTDHLKNFIEFATVLFLFCFVLASRLVGVVSPWPGIDLAPIALEGEVLTTGQWEKSWFSVLNPRKLKANLDQLVTLEARSQEPGKEEMQCSKLSLEYLYKNQPFYAKKLNLLLAYFLGPSKKLCLFVCLEKYVS